MNVCQICQTAYEGNEKKGDYGDKVYFDCPSCGRFGITRPALRLFEDTVRAKPSRRLLVSHFIRTRFSQQNLTSLETPLLDLPYFSAVLDFLSPVTPREQANNFIRWLGDQVRDDDPMAAVNVDYRLAATVMGASSDLGAAQIIQFLLEKNILSGGTYSSQCEVAVTLEGWERYDQLKQSHSEGPIAFMAMPFGQPALDVAYRDCFRPAVSQCGFELRRLDEKPPAGLIDDRLRVEIRRSRFLIVDLTNGNYGAYWEAGFAEGLGKKVIYVCEAGYFSQHGTHFDTSHQHTIIWDSSNLEDAAARLKDTIRATLPAEARMTD